MLSKSLNVRIQCYLRVLLGLTPSPFCVSVDSEVSVFSVTVFWEIFFLLFFGLLRAKITQAFFQQYYRQINIQTWIIS